MAEHKHKHMNEIKKYKQLNDFPVWTVFINIIRMYNINDVIELDKVLDHISYFVEYDRLLQYKSVLVRHGYIMSITTFRVKILMEIPFGLTVGGNVSNKKIQADKILSGSGILNYNNMFKTVDVDEKNYGKIDSDVFPEKSNKNGAVDNLVNKAIKTNENQIPNNTIQNHKEKLGYRDEMRVELGITLRCKNVKKNERGGIMDFDFSGAEISISRLVIDENKYKD